MLIRKAGAEEAYLRPGFLLGVAAGSGMDCGLVLVVDVKPAQFKHVRTCANDGAFRRNEEGFVGKSNYMWYHRVNSRRRFG